MVQAPLGTYTGWNMRARGFGHGALHEFTGSYVPFAESPEERRVTGDPRPAILERYADAEDYLSLARKTASVTKGSKDRDAIEKTKKALSLLERMLRRFPEAKNKVKSGLIESQLYANQGNANLAKTALDAAESQYEILESKETDARLDYAQAQLMSGNKQKAYRELHLLSRQHKN